MGQFLTGAVSEYTYHVVIVDDDSKDGISEVVEKLRHEYPVALHIREAERSLSSAVIHGFNFCHGEVIVVMDADLSHPPEKIPELITPILSAQADFVVGSRFMKQGGVPHFNQYRRLNAWLSKTLARPIAKLTDPMAGFFAFSRGLLRQGDLNLNPVGFKIGLELIVKTKPTNIVEVPIVFQSRLFGKSKLNIKEQFRYIVHLKRLYEYKFQTWAEFLKFSMVGASGIVVDLFFVYIAFEILSIPYRISRIVGFFFALTSNFLLNRKFTFPGSRRGRAYRQYYRFVAVCLTGFAVNWLISISLFEHIRFFHVHYLLSAFMGIGGGVLVNFLGSKFVAFKVREH